MTSYVWDSWPMKIGTDKVVDPTAFPEYKAIHNRQFLSEMTHEIRQNAVTKLRQVIGEDKAQGTAVVIMGGQASDFELYCSDTDKTNFRQESFFMHLFQLNEPDCYGIIDLSTAEGHSTLCIPFLPPESARWNGEMKSTSYYVDSYGVDECIIANTPDNSTQPITDYLKSRGIHTIHLLHGRNSDSGLWTKTTAQFDGMDAFTIDKTVIHRELSLLQSIKTDKEIEYLRVCCNMSARAHAFVMANIRPNITELQCEALFTSYCMFYGGTRANAYTCICGSGPNGAVLHYGHAAHPNSRTLQDGDMIVLDMGGEYNGYATDLTRSYPVNGKYTERQAAVYNIVRKAQLAVYDAIKPGVSWQELHKLAERGVIEGLLELGVLNGTVEECEKAFIGALFMPHGLGHLLGLNVHGVGGYIDCERPTDLGVCWVRLGRVLEKNMVVTVEPGVYFNKPWITQQLEREGVKERVNLEKLEEFWDFGGVRLEDDIVVTEDGYELLTGDWPSTVEEIEAVCAKFKNDEKAIL